MKHIFLGVILFATNIFLANGQQNWSHCGSGTGNMLTGIAYGGNLFIAAGEEGIILSSVDGKKWKQEESPVSDLITSVTYAKGHFVATASGGKILTSIKGNDWVVAYSAEEETTLHSVTFANNQFVAVGSNSAILTSFDAKQWNPVDVSENIAGINLYSVASGAGTTIAVSSDGVILMSKNLLDWEEIDAGDATGFVSVVYGQHKFVAVTEQGKVFSSADGKQWSSKDMLARYPLTVGSMLYANNIFIAVGSPGLMAESKDGITWKELLPDTSGDLLSVCFGKSLFMVSGSMGLIMKSPAAIH